ncbi:copper homeostasis protein CutC [Pararhizobium sp. BT-229]|uniref:copper homeostasis protein CutC n=1 Tax=Pararhizobium sp. BT-229 TaxID=2986923 RepID=UPI0021F6B99B|nr:copper homeostasis protein CutC [Pararhizobium sp. BT-229]MCV9962050.1 copper homeostasis protein CutC [Pararhizobium sp. BT-229]
MTKILLEVCVEDAAGLMAAVEGGADRIELCSALAVGGLTPPPGLMTLAGKLSIPVYAMIRPRPGDFVFDADDIDVMLGDIDAARSAGLAGVVLGASRSDGRLDVAMLRILADHAAGLGLTLHRAFDLVPDFAEAVEIAVDLGFERILTSGGAKKASDGLDALASIVAAADGRISIMPGSGVTLETIDGLLSRLSVSEVHSSCSIDKPAHDARLVSLGFVAASAKRTDKESVRALQARLAAAP